MLRHPATCTACAAAAGGERWEQASTPVPRSKETDMPGRQGGAGAADSAAYLPDDPAGIRNVVLVGPSGSGKTTLVESLLAATGVINRPGRVEDGTTVSDYDEAEIRQQRSVGLSLAPLVVDGVKINLLDAPGYADFVGELRAGLRAADCALFVISARRRCRRCDQEPLARVRSRGYAALRRDQQAQPPPRRLRPRPRPGSGRLRGQGHSACTCPYPSTARRSTTW